MLRKYKSILLVLILMLTVGCSKNNNPQVAEVNETATSNTNTDTAVSENIEKINIVCTTFPHYDWVRELTADVPNIDVTLLMSSLVDLHNYQPSVSDIVQVSSCDVFIYIGGESDDWVEGVLANASNPDMVVVNLIDSLGDRAKYEEIIEGMEHEHDDDDDHDDHDDDDDHDHDDHNDDDDHDHDDHDDHDDDHDHDDHDDDDDHDDHDHDLEIDEHIWLSLHNATVLCAHLTDMLKSIDPENTAVYERNFNAYAKALSALDEEYKTVISAASMNTLLFADRFPFRYMTDDYGLDYYAAFSGCSTETEASFETVVFLAQKADEYALKYIMVTETSNESCAKTVINATTAKDQKILTLDSAHSVTLSMAEGGITYLSIMERNLDVLREALN